MLVRHRLSMIFVACLALATGCAGAKRATVHEQDMAKVFPWPRGKEAVTIRVRPQTTMANMCVWFGSWEQAEVTPQTTFYIVDQAGHKFAYTPERSPIRRLAPLDSMEIRWPLKQPEKPAAAAGADGSAEEAGKAPAATGPDSHPSEKPPGQKEPAPGG